MEEDRPNHNYVAPLQIRKTSHGSESHEHEVTISAFEENYSPRPRFQNFLRASYHFQPTIAPSPSTVTLELHKGDIILVHSIHTNGWADGTLLETGARGWLPTNYCEPYDYATIRPLLKALTEFWDIMRSGNESNDAIFHNPDYMRGMVAGVRFLLEKSDCLTRESGLVKNHDSVRKVRKALLANLSTLVKCAKELQQVAASGGSFTQIEEILDDMLLKAFHVVTRAVAFFDIWSDIVQLSGPPVSYGRATPLENSRQSFATSHSSYTMRQQSIQSFPDELAPPLRQRPSSTSGRRLTLTHRMSYTGRLNQGRPQNLASDRLNATYDAFLGVLASFLGSHMQSRSSSELLLTTQQAVKACRRLVSVVDSIIEHGPGHAQMLMEAKDAMYDKITELVLAAKQVFRPLQSADDEMIYLPSEGVQLVSAATACVSGAGKCVARARIVLEDMGDFEFESAADSSESSPVQPPQNEPALDRFEFSPDPNTFQETRSTPKPRLEITTTIDQQVLSPTSPTPDTSTFWTPVAGPTEDSPVSSGAHPAGNITNPRFRFSRPFIRDIVHSTGSETTLVSSVRDSGPSFVSDASTRATSPDRSPQQKHSAVEAIDPEQDDTDMGEDEIMEQNYAHELLFNAEGRIIGGTLNAVVEQLTAHDSTPDAFFLSTIYLTFRVFTTPSVFAEALFYRFRYVAKTPRIAQPVRLRVYNFLKGWLETHWRHDCDEPALHLITDFAKNDVLAVLPAAGARLLELTEIVASSHQSPLPRILFGLGRVNSSSDVGTQDQPLPPPALSRSQVAALRSWRAGGSPVNIIDFDPLEIARQITIKVSGIFCSIVPEELLSTEFTKQADSLAVNVRSMAQISTDLANLVADSILQLEEPKKRAATVKQWIKVASKCLELNNYDTLMAIVCSINSSTILRLKRTWDLISQKTKNCFEGLKKVVDISKNYSTLRQRIAGHVPPCLPFVGMYLTDLTFVDHGNPATRELKNGNDTIVVVNLDKHMKTARIISDLQRFQMPYRLTEVTEMQNWLRDELVRVRADGERNFQNHYRRSLVLEPRETAPTRQTNTGAFSAITGKEKFDFLGWTHMGKDKSTPVTS